MGSRPWQEPRFTVFMFPDGSERCGLLGGRTRRLSLCKGGVRKLGYRGPGLHADWLRDSHGKPACRLVVTSRTNQAWSLRTDGGGCLGLAELSRDCGSFLFLRVYLGELRAGDRDYEPSWGLRS